MNKLEKSSTDKTFEILRYDSLLCFIFFNLLGNLASNVKYFLNYAFSVFVIKDINLSKNNLTKDLGKILVLTLILLIKFRN